MAVKRNLNAIDTYINEDRPDTNYAKSKRLGVKYPEQFAYATFATPFPIGAKIVKATLSWVTWGEMPETGNHTFNVTPVTSAVPATRMTFNNRPDRDTSKTVTVTKSGAVPHRETWEVDVSDWIQDVSDGEPWYGFRIGTSDTEQRWIYSKNNTAEGVRGPTLRVEWADNPDAPDNLQPNEGVVGTAKPALSFDYVDFGGSTVLSKVHIQVSRTTSFTSPMWDSGWIKAGDGVPVINLVTTSFPGAAVGEKLYYRIRAMDEDNLQSGWSSRAWFQYIPMPALSLISPPPGDPRLITDSTPLISWTQPGTQTAFQIRVYRKGRSQNILYDTGKVTSTLRRHQIPEKVFRWDDKAYEMTLRTWDDEDRVRAPNSLPYNYLKTELWYDEDASSVLPTNVRVEQINNTPRLAITWERAAPADEWEITRSGPGMDSVVVAKISQASALLANGTYRYIDPTAPPRTPLFYTVRPVTNGRRSSGRRTSGDFEFTVEAIWLIQGTTQLVIQGEEQGDWSLPENVTAHQVINAQMPVLVRELRSGYNITMTGLLVQEDKYQPTLTAKDKYRRLMGMKTSDEGMRLIAGDQNIPVMISEVNVNPTPAYDLQYECSFTAWQYDEIWWEEAR